MKSWGANPPISGRIVQSGKVSQTAKPASLVGLASLLELDGLVGEHRANAFESPAQHCPPACGVLSVIEILQQLTMADTGSLPADSFTHIDFRLRRLKWLPCGIAYSACPAVVM